MKREREGAKGLYEIQGKRERERVEQKRVQMLIFVEEEKKDLKVMGRE